MCTPFDPQMGSKRIQEYWASPTRKSDRQRPGATGAPVAPKNTMSFTTGDSGSKGVTGRSRALKAKNVVVNGKTEKKNRSLTKAMNSKDFQSVWFHMFHAVFQKILL